MRTTFISLVITISFLFVSSSAYTQCTTWIGLAEETEITNAYTSFRQQIYKEDYTAAFPFWEIVYNAAPAADGHRTNVYSDGRKMLEFLFNNEANKDKKKAIATLILKLIKEQKTCYPHSDILSPTKEILDYLNQ